MDSSFPSPSSLKSRKVTVLQMCLLENQSGAATSSITKYEVEIQVIQCKPLEKCVDALSDVGGLKYGYNI